MSQHEVPKQSDTDPAYQERLLHVLKDTIHLNAAGLSGHIAAPTPLDPDNVFIRNVDNMRDWNDPDPGMAYRDYAIQTGVESVALYADLSGATEGLGDYFAAETATQLTNRMNHNGEAFTRLAAALMERPADDALLEIVHKARCGMAGLTEMLRLIKEYPEMVSIETSSFYATAGGPERYDPIRAAYVAAGSLVSTFRDAEVKLGGDGAVPHIKESTLIPGSKTRKRVLATAVSADSFTELVLKEIFVSLQGREFLLGVSTYFRTGDHQSRPGYVPDDALPEGLLNDVMPAEQARQFLGRLATDKL